MAAATSWKSLINNQFVSVGFKRLLLLTIFLLTTVQLSNHEAKSFFLPCTGDGIYLYEHSNYEGACQKVTDDIVDLESIGFNDVISSVRLVGSYEENYRAVLCEHHSFSGRCSPFSEDDSSLGDNTIGHDRASSIQIEKTQHHESIRVGTFNSQSFDQDEAYCPFLSACHDGSYEDIPNRHAKLAERIIAGRYDIFVLNEQFEEDSRDLLISRLKEFYPYYVEKIGYLGGFEEDSGLMLFSRFPFRSLPNSQYQACPDPQEIFCNVIAYSDGERWTDVAFIVFEDYDSDGCNGFFGDGGDCAAQKGVAYVRIQNPETEQYYNVVFTHMDAGSGDDDIRARQLNFEAAQALLEGTMHDTQITTESIFMLGDLNVNGDFSIRDGSIEKTEWESIFATPDTFFTETLKDAWEHEMQPEASFPDYLAHFRDRGLTSNVPELFADPERKRLDYFLYNFPDSQALCIQHMSIAYNLRHGEPYQEAVFANAGFQDLSDHYGVNIDINQDAPYCNPSKAYENPPNDTILDGTLNYPGSMQWYRLDPELLADNKLSNGTYSIQVISDGPVDFQVFKSSNLSAPLPRENSVSMAGWTYHAAEEPLYIRVFSTDRTWSGNYELIIHKHSGRSKEDAIDLRADEYLDVPINTNQTKWFRIHLDASEIQQTLQMGLSGPGQATIEIRALDGTTVLHSPTENLIINHEIANNHSVVYMLVTNIGNEEQLYNVGWSTNLIMMHGTLEQPLILRNLNSEEGGFGEDDDIETLKISVNDSLVIDTGGLGDFDDNQVRGLGDVISTVHLESDDELELKLIEYDYTSPNEIISASYTGFLPRTFPMTYGQLHLYEEDDPYPNAAHYYINVAFSHGLSYARPAHSFLADLEVTKRASDTSIVAGSLLTYTIDVTNHGPMSTYDVIVSDTLPETVTYVNSSEECSYESGSVRCDIAEMEADQSKSLYIRVLVNALPGNEINRTAVVFNTATISSGLADPDTSNNSSEVAVEVVSSRIGTDLELFYSFAEEQGIVVHDVSGSSSPLNAVVADSAAIDWTVAGLNVHTPTYINSEAPATQLMNACQATNEITIEAWVKPINNTQDGPARIVTLSSNGSASNFTLGQGRWWPQPSELYAVNLRTTHTSDGGLPATITPNGTLTTDLTHVVYTRSSTDEVARLYINGVETTIRTVGGEFSNWDPSYPLSLAGEITGEFPWLGEFQLLAIYSRALSSEEVDQNFEAGPSDGGDVSIGPDNDDLFGYDYEIWTNPAAPRAEMTTQIGVVVHREGGKQVLENVEVSFYQGDPDEDGIFIGSATVELLSPLGSAISSEVAWVPPSSGAHAIFAVIDPDNDVPESNESNNVLSRIITVLEPAPDQVAPHVDCFTINDEASVTEIPAVTLEACASDPEPGSGVADMLFVEYEYQNDVGDWVVVQISDWLEYMTTPSIYPWTLTFASGVRYFQAWARDGAGNISLYPYQSFINYASPIGSVAQGDGNVYRYTWNEGDFVTVRLEPVSGDPDLYVWAPDYDEGRPPWVSNLSGNSVDTVSFTAPVSGIYQVEVYGYTDAEYRLLVDVIPVATSAYLLESIGGVDSDKPQYSEPIVPLDSVPNQLWPPPNLQDEKYVIFLPFVER